MLRRFPLRFTIREILLTTGALCIGLAWWIEYSTREEATRICVAASEINIGTVITNDMVHWERCVEEKIPEDAVFVPKAVIGMYVASRIYPGEPILANKLLPSIDSINYDKRKFRVATIKIQTPAGSIRQGDYVDIFQSSPDAVCAVVSHAQIFAIHELESGDAWHQISVIVQQSDAELLLLAAERGKLQVVVVQLGDQWSRLPKK